jgi:hypothetical protein
MKAAIGLAGNLAGLAGPGSHRGAINYHPAHLDSSETSERINGSGVA